MYFKWQGSVKGNKDNLFSSGENLNLVLSYEMLEFAALQHKKMIKVKVCNNTSIMAYHY